MNIFALDLDPRRASQWHVDRHVVKMPVEYAQLLSTAHSVLDNNQVGYKVTHVGHPSARWARWSLENYLWLYELFQQTSAEYKYRYGREHGSWVDLGKPLSKPPTRIDKSVPFWPPSIAMSPEYIVMNDWGLPDCVKSYKNYYNLAKRHIHSWSFRPKPDWITDHETGTR